MDSPNSNEVELIEKKILLYLEEDIKESNDISYHQWVSKDDNLKYLCKAFGLEDSQTREKTVRHHDYNCEFKLIKWITEGKEHKDAFAKFQRQGEKLDRHADVVPYSFNAVPRGNSEEKSKSYINASFIHGPLSIDTNLFIATQGPMRKTIEHFWEMIVYNKSRLIIMLSNLIEEGRSKCELYWPNSISTELKLGFGYTLTLIRETILIEDCLIERMFSLSNSTSDSSEVIEIRHLQVICWPDHSIPQSPQLGNKMIEALIASVDNSKKTHPASPVTVHCGAGVGRTGTFIAIYNLTRCLNLSQLKLYNVFNVVRKLREQRYSMVTDAEQYKFIYDFISYWANNPKIVLSN